MTSNDSESATVPSFDNLAAVGLDATIGLTFLTVSATEVKATLEITPAVHQPFGIVHGGTYAAAAESVASWGGNAYLAGKGVAVGVNNSTDFLRQAARGTLTFIGTPISQGRRQQLWQVTSTNSDGKLVASSRVRLQNIDPADVQS